MSEKTFFAIPGIIPALAAETLGFLAGVILLTRDQMLLGGLAIMLGAAPLAFVLIRHSANQNGKGGS